MSASEPIRVRGDQDRGNPLAAHGCEYNIAFMILDMVLGGPVLTVTQLLCHMCRMCNISGRHRHIQQRHGFMLHMGMRSVNGSRQVSHLTVPVLGKATERLLQA